MSAPEGGKCRPVPDKHTPRTLARLARRTLVQALLALSLLAVTVAPARAAATASGASHASRGCAVVYFDLGETLIHTADDGSITYLPHAADYLHALRAHHVRVGLITNVPPEWGATDAERAAHLRQVVDADWAGQTPFAWDDFAGRVLTPRTVEERKPAPTLFARARADAGRCHVVYQAETPEELQVAAEAGFLPYQVQRPEPWPAYLPVPLVTAMDRLPV
jgi:hypothetical protein